MCQPKYVSKFEEKMKEKRKLVTDKPKKHNSLQTEWLQLLCITFKNNPDFASSQDKTRFRPTYLQFYQYNAVLVFTERFFAPKITESHVAETCALDTLKSYLYYGLCAGDNVISPVSSSC